MNIYKAGERRIALSTLSNRCPPLEKGGVGGISYQENFNFTHKFFFLSMVCMAYYTGSFYNGLSKRITGKTECKSKADRC